MSKNCYICEDPLDDSNKSKEHVLLNAIGGRLKSTDLLCSKCNNEQGSDADKHLAEQLAFWSSFFNVKRDSGKNALIKGGKGKSGKTYHLKDGTKPILANPEFNKEVNGNEVTYSLTARDDKEMKSMLEGIKKKHADFDVEKAMDNAQYIEEYLNEPIKFQTVVGGEKSFPSILKTAINFFILNGGRRKDIEDLIPYLNGKTLTTQVKHFHPKKSVYKKDANEIIHMIHMVGSKGKKVLYCFVELFSSFSFLVMLSDNYEGSSLSKTYAYDVLNRKEVTKMVDLKMDKKKFSTISVIEKSDFESINKKILRAFKIGDKKHRDAEVSNLVHRVVERIFTRYSHEKYFTEEMLNALSRELALEYVKFTFRNHDKHQ